MSLSCGVVAELAMLKSCCPLGRYKRTNTDGEASTKIKIPAQKLVQKYKNSRVEKDCTVLSLLALLVQKYK